MKKQEDEEYILVSDERVGRLIIETVKKSEPYFADTGLNIADYSYRTRTVNGMERRMKPEEVIEILRDTPIDIRSTRDDDIHTLYATAQTMAIDALEEVQQYREIGTVEKCREAVEKQKAKKPRDIEYDYSYFICPACGEGIYVSDNFESHKFCLNCGQAIDIEKLEK